MTINKCTKLFCTVQDKENYVVHIRALKQALNYGLILKKVHGVSKWIQARSMAKTVYWYEYWIKKRRKKRIWERFL